MRSPRTTLEYTEGRPGPDWHAHGVTTKDLWVLDHDRLVFIRLRKQRWRHRDGYTCHDRPAWDVPGSPYGLDVVFRVLGVWLLGTLGLHKLDWPWNEPQPSWRSVQRWFRRLLPDAHRWLRAIRLALIELAAPRPLEEKLPTGGRADAQRCRARPRALLEA